MYERNERYCRICFGQTHNYGGYYYDIDYGVSLWSPYRQKDIAIVENIQRRFTKMITGLFKHSYEERLQILGLRTLHERRRRIDLTQAFKIMTGADKVQGQLFTKVSDSHTKTTRQATRENLVVTKPHLDIRKYFFSCRVVKDWNCLPHSLQQAHNVPALKRELEKVTLA